MDHLVKNVGYPFHLQIATKEFLNELVKRFPERPPMFPSQAQTKILSLIHEWKNTICTDSKRKEDLVHIRDMHRLLTYKGYRFPALDSRAKGVLNPENNLQSPEELEEEDRAAQAAKLQELIRRGTPRDLEQAQELMKIMSGAVSIMSVGCHRCSVLHSPPILLACHRSQKESPIMLRKLRKSLTRCNQEQCCSMTC